MRDGTQFTAHDADIRSARQQCLAVGRVELEADDGAGLRRDGQLDGSVCGSVDGEPVFVVAGHHEVEGVAAADGEGVGAAVVVFADGVGVAGVHRNIAACGEFNRDFVGDGDLAGSVDGADLERAQADADVERPGKGVATLGTADGLALKRTGEDVAGEVPQQFHGGEAHVVSGGGHDGHGGVGGQHGVLGRRHDAGLGRRGVRRRRIGASVAKVDRTFGGLGGVARAVGGADREAAASLAHSYIPRRHRARARAGDGAAAKVGGTREDIAGEVPHELSGGDGGVVRRRRGDGDGAVLGQRGVLAGARDGDDGRDGFGRGRRRDRTAAGRADFLKHDVDAVLRRAVAVAGTGLEFAALGVEVAELFVAAATEVGHGIGAVQLVVEGKAVGDFLGRRFADGLHIAAVDFREREVDGGVDDAAVEVVDGGDATNAVGQADIAGLTADDVLDVALVGGRLDLNNREIEAGELVFNARHHLIPGGVAKAPRRYR